METIPEVKMMLGIYTEMLNVSQSPEMAALIRDRIECLEERIVELRNQERAEYARDWEETYASVRP